MLLHLDCHEKIHRDPKLKAFYKLHFVPVWYRQAIWHERGRVEVLPTYGNFSGYPTLPIKVVTKPAPPPVVEPVIEEPEKEDWWSGMEPMVWPSEEERAEFEALIMTGRD